jgi:hypothetical protein
MRVFAKQLARECEPGAGFFVLLTEGLISFQVSGTSPAGAGASREYV